MKYGRELAREKGKTEQESEEERGKFLSTPGCHDYICFLLSHNNLPLLSGSVMSDFLATPWTIARQAPLSIGFPMQE